MEPGNFYAINSGTYIGQFFSYIKKQKKEHIFFSIPGMYTVIVPDTKLHKGLKAGIISFQEKLPDDVFNVILEQYKKSKKWKRT